MSQAPRFRAWLSAGFAAVVLLGSGVAGSEERAKSFAKLKPGMTPEQVRHIAGGAPKHIARQILYHRYREQWIYEASTPVRLTFDCPRGQAPQLLSVSGFSVDKRR